MKLICYSLATAVLAGGVEYGVKRILIMAAVMEDGAGTIFNRFWIVGTHC